MRQVNARLFVTLDSVIEAPEEWVKADDEMFAALEADYEQSDADVAKADKRLKDEDGKDILVNGSGALVRALTRDHLLDELRLLVHPVVVGSGTRLFGGESDPAELSLADSHAYANGVMGLTYLPTTAAGDET